LQEEQPLALQRKGKFRLKPWVVGRGIDRSPVEFYNAVENRFPLFGLIPA